MAGYVILASNVSSSIKWYFDSSEKSFKIQGSEQQQKFKSLAVKSLQRFPQ